MPPSPAPLARLWQIDYPKREGATHDMWSGRHTESHIARIQIGLPVQEQFHHVMVAGTDCFNEGRCHWRERMWRSIQAQATAHYASDMARVAPTDSFHEALKMHYIQNVKKTTVYVPFYVQCRKFFDMSTVSHGQLTPDRTARERIPNCLTAP
jgi:hypothetical protein